MNNYKSDNDFYSTTIAKYLRNMTESIGYDRIL